MDFSSRYQATLAALRPADAAAAALLERQKYRIFYTDPRVTLTPGPLYFCGLKPYGHAGRSYNVVSPHERPPRHAAYLDESIAGSDFARRAVRLLESLQATMGLTPGARDVFCTNWFFYRAPDTKALQAYGLERIAHPDLHADFLRVVLPRVVVCVGNGPVSAFRGMCRLHGLGEADEDQLPVARSARLKYAWTDRFEGAQLEGQRLILGLPHLSRYDLDLLLPSGETLLAACERLVIDFTGPYIT